MLNNINSINEIDINKFDNYGVIKPGGFGIVYKIQEKRTHNLFAAKILVGDYSNEHYKTMVDREIAILKFVNHPTIIKYFGYSLRDIHNENNVTIITEFAKNGSLSDILEKILSSNGPSNYDNTTRQIILTGVSRGMKYLHDLDIIHRDLKPGNILLDENYRPLITDFGLSKFYQDSYSNIQSQIVGTSIYMAPEVHNGTIYDSKADVYSFGILMFEVVTDTVPYPKLKNHEIDANEFKDKVVNHNYRPEFKYHVKESFKKLIEKCWSADPKERPTFGEIFNKLSSKDDDTYLLDDVDIDEFNLYVEDINKVSTPIDELIKKNEKLEKDKNYIKGLKRRLQTENNQIKVINEQLQIENNQIKTINEQLNNGNNQIRAINNHLQNEIANLRNQKNEIIDFIMKNQMFVAIFLFFFTEIIAFNVSFSFELNNEYFIFIIGQAIMCYFIKYKYKTSYYIISGVFLLSMIIIAQSLEDKNIRFSLKSKYIIATFYNVIIYCYYNYNPIDYQHYLLYSAICIINVIIFAFTSAPNSDTGAFSFAFIGEIVLYIIVMNTKKSFSIIIFLSFFLNAVWHFSTNKGINSFIGISTILQYVFFFLEMNDHNMILIIEMIIIAINHSQLKGIIIPVIIIQGILYFFTQNRLKFFIILLIPIIGFFIILMLIDVINSDQASSGFKAAIILLDFNTSLLIAFPIIQFMETLKKE